MMRQVAFFTLVIVFNVVETRIHEEPSCSKFHFEEKVLEKLVRLEHRMEVWDGKLNKKLSILEETELDWIDKIQKHIAENNEAEIKRTDIVSKQIMKLTEAEVAHKAATLKVVFRAKTIADKTPATNSMLRFTETDVNVGEGYDTETGYFTVPRDGTYLFNVQICTVYKNDLVVQIIAADSIVGTVYNYDHNAYLCTPGTAVAILSTGDKVWIKTILPSTLHDDIYRRSIFWGVLIHTNTK